MNSFSEYEKMPKDFKKLNLDVKELSDLNKLKWIVTEKIHGANFSFIYEELQLKFAKRKDYLQWDDDFFGFQIIVHQLESQIIQLFEELSAEIPASRYIIYGELFGGQYPHPEVQPDKNVQAIQTGVFYSPTINFYAFDIALETTGGKRYLDYDKAITYFDKYKLYHAKIVFTGKLHEAMQFNLRMNSTIPADLKLPPLENNLMEGIVIKPLNHSNSKVAMSRPVLKIKNPEFDEDEKFHEAKKWTFVPNVSSNTEELSFLVNDLRNYVNANRVNSAISKIGSLDSTNSDRLNEIQDEIQKDVLVDFNENNNNILSDLTDDQTKWIKARLRRIVYEFLIKK